MEYDSAIRRKQILSFATIWMELEGIMLSEISQAEKDKYQMISYVEYKNKGKLKEQNSSRITESKNGLTVTKGKGTGEDVWEGREKWGEKKVGLMINMYNVVGCMGRAVQHREDK